MNQQTITPMTATTAKLLNIYAEFTTASKEKDVALFFHQHRHKPEIFIKTISGQEIIMDIRAINTNAISIFDAATGKMLVKCANTDSIVHMILKQPTEQYEISNGKTSVFLDEYSFNYYLNKAKQIQADYGNSYLPETKLSGDKYYAKIQEMVNIAKQIGCGQLIPNLLDNLPFKKDGTFTTNQKIPIYKNGIAKPLPNKYGASNYVLAIITENAETMDDHFDFTNICAPNRARFAITAINGIKNITPLLNTDLSLNNIKTN